MKTTVSPSARFALSTATYLAFGATLLALGACGGPPAEPLPSQSNTTEPACTNSSGSSHDDKIDLRCTSLKSVSGKDTTGDLGWLSSDPLFAKTATMNGGLMLILKTPCNTVNAPFEISGDQLVTDPTRFMTTAMGCIGQKGEEEKWVTEFFKIPVTYSAKDQTLTFTNELGEIRLVKNP